MTRPSTEITSLYGVLVVDKPEGMTSHDVVSGIRKKFRTRKVGHLGTLDPMATGVLPLTLGPATRLARFVPASPKEYVGTIQLGWETTTADREGEPMGETRPAQVERDRVIDAMRSFVGTGPQIPPAFSAKKIDGQRAYRLARKGEEVALSPIEVTIDAFVAVEVGPSSVDFRVVCSGGTYVRSLARDIGRRLGTGGHLTRLRRTRSGPFLEEQSVSPDHTSTADIIGPEIFLSHLPRVEAGDDHAESLRHGRQIELAGPDGYVCIFNKSGDLLSVARRKEGWAHPEVVLI
jgi:tRNA pseudouridine55 synthase